MKARRCARGHMIRGKNVLLKRDRQGKRQRRCRRCVNLCQRRLMRKRRTRARRA